MRIIRIVVILLVALGALIPMITLAADTTNTETNTNTLKGDFNSIKNLILPKKVFAKEPIDEIFQAVEPVSIAPDERLSKILAQWREKQINKWNSLAEKSFTINASAYTASADECGNSKGITASGLKVEANRTIACPPEYPFGLKIEIEGKGTYICEDRGGAIKGNHIDIYVETKKEALAFGRRNLNARIILE